MDLHWVGIYPYPSKRIVYDLKSVGPSEFKLVAPMPEQLKTTAMHFYEVLLWSRLVLGWVQRNSNFGSLDRRLEPL